MSRLKRNLVLGLVALLIAAAVTVALLLLAPREYDRDFDASITKPAYPNSGPLILYDEAHLNTHTADAGYRPLLDLVRNDGFQVRVARQPLTPQALHGVSILFIVLPRGANETNDSPAFSDSETAVVSQWVRAGGSLLLVTDHWPFGVAVASLARALEIDVGGGLVEDPQHHDPKRGNSHLVFSADNGLLKDHPIIRGRTASEHVRKVLTFTGTSLAGPPAAVPLLDLSSTAIEYPPTTPRLQKDGSSVRVHMDYGAPVSAAGRAQALTLELGHGRIVALAEAGMLRATPGSPDERVGMNVGGYDNRQLAINIVHWLARVL